MTRTGEDEKEYLPRRQRPEAECRLIVLLLLSELPDASDSFLLRCCAEGELLSYFELMPALSRLAREGQATRREDGTVLRYRLTQAGEETLHMFLARVPASDRGRIAGLLPKWRDALRMSGEFTSQVHPLEKGGFEVELSVWERDELVLRLTAPVPSSELAARLCGRWEKAGPGVLQQMMALMNGQEEA